MASNCGLRATWSWGKIAAKNAKRYITEPSRMPAPQRCRPAALSSRVEFHACSHTSKSYGVLAPVTRVSGLSQASVAVVVACKLCAWQRYKALAFHQHRQSKKSAHLRTHVFLGHKGLCDIAAMLAAKIYAYHPRQLTKQPGTAISESRC